MISYDLAVWIRPVPADDAEALERFIEFMEGMERDLDADQAPPPAPELDRYADELLERYPDITPDGDEESPWATGPLKRNIVGSLFYFSMTYRPAEDAIPFIVDRAQANQLVCFDPQTESFSPAPTRRTAGDGGGASSPHGPRRAGNQRGSPRSPGSRPADRSVATWAMSLPDFRHPRTRHSS